MRLRVLFVYLQSKIFLTAFQICYTEQTFTVVTLCLHIFFSVFCQLSLYTHDCVHQYMTKSLLFHC